MRPFNTSRLITYREQYSRLQNGPTWIKNRGSESERRGSFIKISSTNINTAMLVFITEVFPLTRTTVVPLGITLHNLFDTYVPTVLLHLDGRASKLLEDRSQKPFHTVQSNPSNF
uniref:Uncharacterized protein n=1 Tax=Lygus hesperus TaxID=30085 RepID=A0A146KUM4_LYGHE